ncbi:MAG: aldehyde dehydrogenase family protein [bacterium]|nr:aldehyde dehydrogenase family protein [bacterium]
MSEVYKNFINGEWVSSHSGQTFENRNPANTDEVVGVFQKSDKVDVQNAIDAAKAAYKKWRLVPAPKRAEILFKVGQMLVERKEKYANDMTREMGKVLNETRGDVQEAIDISYFTAGEGRRLHGQTTPSELPNKFQMSVRQPLGVCGMITPWNFPMAIPSWKMIPALVCGNTVVIKPATDTPLSVVNFIKTMEDAGMPKGVVNMVTGTGSGVGDPLMNNSDVKVVSFTGSTEIGSVVSKACAPDFKHCSLEMGGKNAMMVMPSAKLELAVDGALWGAFGTTGQRCTATSRIIVHKDVYKQFVEKLAERARKLRVGNGLDANVDMGPAVNQSQLDTDLHYIEVGKKDGGRLVCGGERLTGPGYDKGYFVQPTIYADITQKMTLWKEEVFGPVLSIAMCESLENAIEMANDSAYGLSASLYTMDVNEAFTAMRDVYTGIFYVNSPTIGAEVHLPFGGTKATGNGHREAGHQALDVFSEWKSIYVDFSGTLQRAQIDA